MTFNPFIFLASRQSRVALSRDSISLGVFEVRRVKGVRVLQRVSPCAVEIQPEELPSPPTRRTSFPITPDDTREQLLARFWELLKDF